MYVDKPVHKDIQSKKGGLTVLESIRVGHSSDLEGMTGLTVFLPPEDTVASCEVRGGAPGTKDTELLRPTFTVMCVDAVLLTGGSALGLGSAQGVTRYLEEQGRGLPTPGGPVPIVSAAVVFDLDVGKRAAPTEEMAYRACLDADTEDIAEGSVGAGTGTSVGNVLGRQFSTKGGFGLFRWALGELKVEAAAAVNCFGDVVDEKGEVLAGVRDSSGNYAGAARLILGSGMERPFRVGENTTLVVVATNASLTVEQCARLALQGHNGIARAIRPSHTRYDGDTVFVMATCDTEAAQDVIEVAAADCAAGAIRSAVTKAESAAGIPCAREVPGS